MTNVQQFEGNGPLATATSAAVGLHYKQPTPLQQPFLTHPIYPTNTINTTITPISNNCEYSEDGPCEKYLQFMDSSRQERTFMIEKLVETFANVIDSIWNPSYIVQDQKVKVMPTRGFCNEIFKRSKTTYSTLQISLFYIFRIKKAANEKLVQRALRNKQQSCNNMQTNTSSNQQEDLMCCGRRMFLASLMLASKYLHDKNYHNKAWSKITGLDLKEINAAEMAFLKLIDYRLYVSKPTFDKWYTQLHGHIQRGYKASNTSVIEAVGTTASVINAMTGGCQQNINNLVHNNANIMHHGTTYPSPPPDAQHPMAPLSPPIQSGHNNDNGNGAVVTVNLSTAVVSTTGAPTAPTLGKTYERSDSGISFSILSPPSSQSFGTKRSFDNDEAHVIINSKRMCQ